MSKLTRSIIQLSFFSVISIVDAWAEWKFSGSAGPYLNHLSIPNSTVTQSQKTGLNSEIKLDNKINSNWRTKVEFNLRTDFAARDSVEFFQWIPKNLFLQKRQGPLTFRAGLQTLVVDGPDLVNPADVIHARNWIDPTAPLPMSSAGLSVSQQMSQWNWEILYVPKQTTPVLPGEHSPWLPRKNRLPIESANLEIRIPDNIRYQYVTSKELNNALSNNLTLKVQRKSNKLEFQGLYYNGLSQLPFITTQASGSLISLNPDVILVNGTVKLIPLYYRHQALAGTFMIPFESWAIRGGMNWLRPQGQDSRLPKETTLIVAGLEKSIETPIGVITGVADYVRQKRQNADQISFLRSIFEEALTFGLRVPYGKETTFFGGGLYDLLGSSSMAKFALSHRFTSSWSAQAGAQFLQGPSKTLIGLYERYDSYELKLMFYW
jgi:hypothetical protein